MFYNGTKNFLSTFMYIAITWVSIVFITSFKVFMTFSKLGFNESLILLNLISSSIFTYLFLFYVIFYFFYKYSKHTIYPIFIFYLIIIFYFYDFSVYFNVALQIFNTTNINTNLQNGLVNIHPFFIFILYSIFVYLYICMHHSNNLVDINVIYFRKYILYTLLILFGIALGAWWAAQEFNWGGFWSWDPVELLSLLLFFVIATKIHTKHHAMLLPNNTLFAYMVVLIYCVMRLGVINTIHSFIRSVNTPYYAYIYAISIFVVLCYIVAIRYYNTPILFKKGLKPLYMNNIFFLFTLLLILMLISLIYINFSILSIPVYVFLDKLYICIGLYYILAWLIYSIKHISMSAAFICVCVYIIFTTTTTYTLVIVMFTILYIFKKNYNILHLVLLVTYIMFVWFFNQILVYFVINTNIDLNVSVNGISHNIGTLAFYETSFFEFKKIYFLDIKNNLQHIFGFNLITNIITTFYFFTKTTNNKIMFGEELIFTCLVSLMLMILFNYFIIKKHNVVVY